MLSDMQHAVVSPAIHHACIAANSSSGVTASMKAESEGYGGVTSTYSIRQVCSSSSAVDEHENKHVWLTPLCGLLLLPHAESGMHRVPTACICRCTDLYL